MKIRLAASWGRILWLLQISNERAPLTRKLKDAVALLNER